MAKLTVDDLKRIKEEVRSTTVLREGGFRAKVNIHMGTCGIAAGARPDGPQDPRQTSARNRRRHR